MPEMLDNGPQSSEGARGAELAYLDQALWKRLHEARSKEEFAAAWLTLQCSMLPGVRAGVVVLNNDDGGPCVPVASWPDGKQASPALASAAESSLNAGKGVAAHTESGACAAYPIIIDERLRGVAAVDVDTADEAVLRSLMRQLQWGCGWLEANLRSHAGNTDVDVSEDARLAVELSAQVLEAQRFQHAATALVTELAIRLGCERVSFGIRQGRHSRVLALSHSAQFGKAGNLTRAIALAMDEAIDQQCTLIYPQPEGNEVCVDRAHAELAQLGKGRHLCTVPLSDQGDWFGALTFDTASTAGFSERQRSTMERAAAFVGPVIASRYREDRWIGHKVWRSLADQLGKLFGPRFLGRKLVALAIVGVVSFMVLVSDIYRIRAEATLEGAVERVAVAPIAGYVTEAAVRAGDRVQQGDLLFRIDDRDLRLEYLKWSSQKAQVERKLRDALAQHERSEVNILRAQLDQANAQLSLVGEQIERTRVTAPFDGIVVSGDLSDQLGAPVERGQILFEIAPLDAYRVALQVPEGAIDEIRVGQIGRLVLASMPDRALPLRIDGITPVSTAAEGKNSFRVDASLLETPDYLRPGMQGAARIEVEERRLLWIWTHDLIDWLRLRIWSWWP
ncbi:MAG: HlyD family efflux transporter periplasmic adaptor subunit [Oceanospirillaceae bacterium]|nr:HlyD family efflux transporter periplasmic adaptor subunit [Oceanospirillaceae bacterium]